MEEEAFPLEQPLLKNGFQWLMIFSSRLQIPMIHGIESIDAVHGHSNVYKATVLSHNVGVGATK